MKKIQQTLIKPLWSLVLCNANHKIQIVRICPFQNSCVALQKNSIHQLPVKIKPNKVSKKHFNFLVFISKDNKTILEKREGKGIWQNLYQFPLIETKTDVDFKEFQNTCQRP